MEHILVRRRTRTQEEDHGFLNIWHELYVKHETYFNILSNVFLQN